jgi:histidinol phosphatase-like PHP family hydrolase
VAARLKRRAPAGPSPQPAAPGGFPAVDPLAPRPEPPFDSDSHIHTIYSGHSGPEMFIPAVMHHVAALRLRRAVILEHVPTLDSEAYLKPGKWLAGRDDRAVVSALAAELAPRRAIYPDTRFLLGVEVDADPVKADGSLMLADLSGVDYVLAATHVLPGGGEFWFDRPLIPEAELPAVQTRWLDWLGRVARHPEVDALAHPACELAACRLAEDFSPNFRRKFHPVAEAMAANTVAFELNEAALNRLSPREILGYAELVRMVRECGVRFTAGSDAHRGAQLGGFAVVRALADAAGLEPGDFWEPAPPGPASPDAL